MYEDAKYMQAISGINTAIYVKINGIYWSVPLDPDNSDYAAIMALVEAGELTIAPAEGAE